MKANMSLDYPILSVSETVLNMYESMFHVLAFADALLLDQDNASKCRLEVELKTLKGFLEIALEQLEIVDFEEEFEER